MYLIVVFFVFLFTTAALSVGKERSCFQLVERVKERTSELEQTNQQLANANHLVENAADAQLEHFACMSREIRTPLSCIIGCSSLMPCMLSKEILYR